MLLRLVLTIWPVLSALKIKLQAWGISRITIRSSASITSMRRRRHKSATSRSPVMSPRALLCTLSSRLDSLRSPRKHVPSHRATRTCRQSHASRLVIRQPQLTHSVDDSFVGLDLRYTASLSTCDGGKHNGCGVECGSGTIKSA